MIRILPLLVCVLSTLPVSVRAQSTAAAIPGGMAYFSPSRAFELSSDGKAAIARVTALESERARTAQEKSLAIESMERSLQQSGSVLSESARDLRLKEIEKFRIDRQRFIEDAQAELMGVRRDAESAFLVKLRPAIERVVKDNAIQLLFNFDSGVLAWGDPSLDVTGQILTLVEAPTETGAK